MLMRNGWSAEDSDRALEMHRQSLHSDTPRVAGRSPAYRTALPSERVVINAAQLTHEGIQYETLRSGLYEALRMLGACAAAVFVALGIGILCAFIFGVGPFYTPTEVLR